MAGAPDKTDEITPEMIEAGETYLRDHWWEWPNSRSAIQEMLKGVAKTMLAAARFSQEMHADNNIEA